MPAELLVEAGRLESINPDRAAAGYARVERANRDFSRPLFLLAVGGVLCAGMVEFLARQAGDSHLTERAGVLLLVGYVPPVAVAMVRGHRRFLDWQDPDQAAHEATVYFPMWVLLHMFEPVVVVTVLAVVAIPYAVAAGILAFFVGLPVVLFSDMPVDSGPTYDDVVGISAALFVLVALISYLAESAPSSLLSPVQGVREIVAGLTLGWRRVLVFLTSVYVITIVETEWWQAAAVAGIAGLALGCTLAPIPRDEAVLRLAELGRIRCDIRRRRRYAARWRILQLHEQTRRRGSPGTWVPRASRSATGDLAAEIAECLGALVPQSPWGDPAAAQLWGDEGWGSLWDVGKWPPARWRVRRDWQAWRNVRIPKLLYGLNHRVGDFGEQTPAWKASIMETTRLVEERNPRLAGPDEETKRRLEQTRAELVASIADARETYSSNEVIELFARAGIHLIVLNIPVVKEIESLEPFWSERYEGEELDEKYGSFFIQVFKNDQALVDALTRDAHGDADERGIRWSVSAWPSGLHYQAMSRYGNVVLYWHAGKQKTVDARWERVNSILASDGVRPA